MFYYNLKIIDKLVYYVSFSYITIRPGCKRWPRVIGLRLTYYLL